jgi:ABC-type molybdate transport system substrate-binding protein
MKSKLRPLPADRIAQAMPSGEADMIVVTLSVVMVPGTEVVGLVPAELQFYNTFAGAVASKAQEPATALALLRALTGADAAAVLQAHGMKPGVPR